MKWVMTTGGHPYSHWIRTYSAPTYLRMPAVKERIIDQLGADVPYGMSSTA